MTHRPLSALSRVAGAGVCILLAASVAFAQNFRIFDPAPGLAQKAPNDPPPFMHWDLREFPGCQVPWVMGTAPVIDLDGNSIPDEPADRAIMQNVLQTAFNRWDAVLPSDLGYVNTPGPGVPVGGYFLDGYNTIIFDSTSLPVATVAAVMLTRNANTGVIIEADVVFNSNTAPVPYYGVRHFVQQAHGSPVAADLDLPPYFNWPNPADGDTDVNGNAIQEWNVDLLSVACHELGHFTGIAHIFPLGGQGNNPANAVMEQYWYIPLGPLGSGWANQVLKAQDRDAENFLYTPDMGDAPDPWQFAIGQYPTLVHQSYAGRTLNGLLLDKPGAGAEHILGIKPRQAVRNWTYEWLGQYNNSNVDGECEANIVDLDQFDDGVTFYPNPPIWGRTLNVTSWVCTANDNLGNFHDYSLAPMWVNTWIDLNQDGVWLPFPPEWFLSWPLAPLPLAGPNAVGVSGVTGAVQLPAIPANPSRAVWLRARLDWGEDVGVAANIDSTLQYSGGAAQFGEVEDYPLWCSRRYEQHWVQLLDAPGGGLASPPINARGFRDVYSGVPDGLDQAAGAEVDAGGCVVQPVQPANHSCVYGGADETTEDFVLDTYLTLGHWMRSGKCRASATVSPLTLLRTYWFTDLVAFGTASPPPGAIPSNLWIPSVNVGHCLVGPELSPTGVVVSVGAVDIWSGGWLSPFSTERVANASQGMAWSDTLRVAVSYRVAPNVVPLQNLSPCDPMYSALPQVFVGNGSVTPDRPFEFPLSIPGNIASGQSLIVEVTTSWRTNSSVSHQLVELPSLLGAATTAEGHSLPDRLRLDSYPNPFNPATTIRLSLPSSAVVSLGVYDVTGHLVATLMDRVTRPAGFFDAQWKGTDDSGRPVSSGVYFFRLTAGEETVTRKAVLLK